MDPLEKVLPDKDTTFAFMLETIGRGHQAYFVALHDLYAIGAHAFAGARRCAVMRGTPHYRFIDDGADYPLENFDAIFMRKDPPADDVYVRHDAAQLGRSPPHFRAQRARGPARGQREALRAEFPRRDSAHAGEPGPRAAARNSWPSKAGR